MANYKAPTDAISVDVKISAQQVFAYPSPLTGNRLEGMSTTEQAEYLTQIFQVVNYARSRLNSNKLVLELFAYNDDEIRIFGARRSSFLVVRDPERFLAQLLEELP